MTIKKNVKWRVVDIWSEEEKKIASGKMAAGKTGIKKPKIEKKKLFTSILIGMNI
ncbi:hypothetical protein [Enterococcus sp. BWB1-3]|uniref:hypothetical protein n=1 Tax=Enterococcus sp. BWB1-3 TaxID=2787713 RepID=UPI001923CBB3|nr:hypothetical protein [Enterococcus sp. BWB1-3]